MGRPGISQRTIFALERYLEDKQRGAFTFHEDELAPQ
jgi:hypothetical protein